MPGCADQPGRKGRVEALVKDPSRSRRGEGSALRAAALADEGSAALALAARVGRELLVLQKNLEQSAGMQQPVFREVAGSLTAAVSFCIGL